MYFTKRNELSTEQGCMLCGSYVEIISTCHQVMLDELCAEHRCINQTKALASSYVWWPGMEATVKNTVKKYAVYHSVKN